MSTSTSENPSGSQNLTYEGGPSNLPTEILLILFECFAPRDFIRCRQVCTHWRDIIDAILDKDTKWEQFCKHDFPKIYKAAMWKTPDITSWHEMYRTLFLWSSLDKACETVDELCHSEVPFEEMRNVTVQKKGSILVQTRTAVQYYNLLSLSVARRRGFSLQLVSLVELKDFVVMLGIGGDLHIVKKFRQDWHSDVRTGFEDEVIMNDVKSYFVHNRTVFLVKFVAEINAYNLDEETLSLITLPENIDEWPNSIVLGFKNGCLYILTLKKELYAYKNKTTAFKFKLDSSTNLMNCLYQHNMLDNLEWRYYYILLATLQQQRHKGRLDLISKMHVYGDELFFVGTHTGVLNIYYKPFVDGELNLTQFPPVKSVNFTTQIEIPILSRYPVMNIQVVETKVGHTVLVCMPIQVGMITYRNDFIKK